MDIYTLNQLLVSEKDKKALCLNESTVAELLGCSPSTLANYRANACGIAFIKVNNGKKSRIMYPKDAIIDFLNAQVVKLH